MTRDSSKERTTLTVRVSRADLDSFEAQAAQAGMSRSEWVRNRLVNGKGEAGPNPSAFTKHGQPPLLLKTDPDLAGDAYGGRPAPPPFKPNRDLIGYIEAGQHPPGWCAHPRWRRLAGICLRCGEKIK